MDGGEDARTGEGGEIVEIAGRVSSRIWMPPWPLLLMLILLLLLL